MRPTVLRLLAALALAATNVGALAAPQTPAVAVGAQYDSTRPH